MDEKMHIISKTEELLNWMKEHEEFKNMNCDDAALLIYYLKEHDYRLSTDNSGDLLKVDISEGMTVEYSLDELIDLVCEWNYGMIEEYERLIKEKTNASEHKLLNEKLTDLKRQEERLDRLFEQTCYSSEIDKLAYKLAHTILDRMGIVGAEQAISELKQNIRANPVGGIR